MKVLVTGGSGFLGARLVSRLAADGWSVRATYNSHQPTAVHGVEWVRLAMAGPVEQFAAVVAGCDQLIHLAALAHQTAVGREAEFMRVNVEGTRLLARAAAAGGAQRLVLVSSIAAITTRSEAAVADWSIPAPTEPYGRSKLQAEQALAAELECSPTDWCAVRPPLVYGPGNPGNMRRLQKLMSSGWPLPFGAIHNLRSFVFVDNLIDALVRVLQHPRPIASTFVLSDGSDFSTPDLVRALSEAAGAKVRMVSVPTVVLTALGRMGDGVRRLTGNSVGLDSNAVDRLTGSLPVDGSRFREFFDWQPPVRLESALHQTMSTLR